MRPNGVCPRLPKGHLPVRQEEGAVVDVADAVPDGLALEVQQGAAQDGVEVRRGLQRGSGDLGTQSADVWRRSVWAGGGG